MVLGVSRDFWVSAGTKLLPGEGVLLGETEGRVHRGGTLDVFQNWYATRSILVQSQVKEGGIRTEKGKYERYKRRDNKLCQEEKN